MIALMLGRLRMSLSECKAAYLKLSSQIFQPRHEKWKFGSRTKDFLMANGKFDSTALESAIKMILADYAVRMSDGSTAESILLEDIDSQCKVFVCTVRAENNEAAFLRTYENPTITDALSNEFKVWEACRATSAATTFFEPFIHAEYGQKFIDGGLHYNNPVALVLQEAIEMWPDDQTLLISIGTGNAPGQTFTGNLATVAQGLKAIATETEKTAKLFHRSHSKLVDDKMYFRFNVPGMASIGLQDHQEIPGIATASQTYLEDSETGRKLTDCATNMADSLMKERQKFPMEIERECLTYLGYGGMDAREQNVQPAFDHTCMWIRDHQVYQDWFTEDHGLLWISGKPGSGKSTLLKHALDFTIESVPKESTVASFFFNSRSGLPLEASPLGMFRALLCQMLEQRQSQAPFEELLEKFVKKKERSRTNDWQWQLAEVRTSFRAATSHPSSAPLYIFVDALDECSGTNSQELVVLFEQIVALSPMLSICVSTRHTPYLAYKSQSTICMEWENSGDITLYVQAKLQYSMTEKQKYDFSRRLVRKASGVFLWIELVLKMLASALDIGATETELKETLDTFPEELGELYQSMLDKIPPRHWPAACQLMQWVLYAERPLATKELRYALAFSRVPPYHSVEDWESSPDFVADDIQMQKRMLGLTCGLVEVGRSTRAPRQQRSGPRKRYGRVDGQIKPLGAPSSKVQFVHQSVRDFLMDRNVLGKGHEMLMRSCVAYIATPNVQISAAISPADEFESMSQAEESTFVSWPTYQVSFLHYAVNQCFVHAQKAECLEQTPVVACLRQFHLPADNMFRRWQQMYDQYRSRIPSNQQGSKATLLHIASEHRLTSLVKKLIELKSDVNEQGGKYGNALQASAVLGFHDIAKLLLDHGAKITLPGKHTNALYSAAYGGDPKTVKLLLERGTKVNKNLVNEIGGPDGTPLQVAMHEGHLAATEVLVPNGANLRQRVSDGQTPLQWIIRTGCTIASRKYIPQQMQQNLDNAQVAIVQYLLARDSDLEATDDFGRTALLIAVYERRSTLLRILIQYGANIEARDRYYGRTPLILAAWRGVPAVVQTLLSQNADLEARDDHGQTALLRAASGGQPFHLSIFESLIEKGAKTEIETDSQGERTAIGAAAMSGRLPMVQFLVERGYSLEVLSKNGATPLISAAERGHHETVRLLLDSGAKINAINFRGETALLIAVKELSRKNEHLVRIPKDLPETDFKKERKGASTLLSRLKHTIAILISQGANLELEDEKGLGGTAIYYSAGGGHIMTTRLLIEHGADFRKTNTTTMMTPLETAQAHGHGVVVQLLLNTYAKSGFPVPSLLDPPAPETASSMESKSLNSVKENGLDNDEQNLVPLNDLKKLDPLKVPDTHLSLTDGSSSSKVPEMDPKTHNDGSPTSNTPIQLKDALLIVSTGSERDMTKASARGGPKAGDLQTAQYEKTSIDAVRVESPRKRQVHFQPLPASQYENASWFDLSMNCHERNCMPPGTFDGISHQDMIEALRKRDTEDAGSVAGNSPEVVHDEKNLPLGRGSRQASRDQSVAENGEATQNHDPESIPDNSHDPVTSTDTEPHQLKTDRLNSTSPLRASSADSSAGTQGNTFREPLVVEGDEDEYTVKNIPPSSQSTTEESPSVDASASARVNTFREPLEEGDDDEYTVKNIPLNAQSTSAESPEPNISGIVDGQEKYPDGTLSDGKLPDILCLGASKAGKSALLRRFGERQSDETWIRFSTLGFLPARVQEVNTMSWPILRLLLEKSLHCRCLVIVFDVGDVMSFHEVETLSHEIQEWQQTQSSRKLSILLVGNKDDTQENQREVSSKCAERFCHSLGWTYLETSAHYAPRTGGGHLDNIALSLFSGTSDLNSSSATSEIKSRS